MAKTTLCYVECEDCYLMLNRNKRENDYNKGKWIGIGGHIEDGETPMECIIREAKEEANLDINPVLRGKIYFIDSGYSEVMYLFTANVDEKKIIECDEGTLAWIEKSKILDLNLWEGDKLFLKRLTQSKEYFELELFYINGNFIKGVFV
ncbi:MAG: 8-oxo-dGTP diphosphatase [Acholeplasmatales bacterium]|nr:8-oxo-dGTP diphosphatase [Acholeplasmatales bacterium]